MLVAPGPRVDMQMPGLPVMSPQVAASIAPATSCFISRNRIWRWRAASINSTDSPPGWPTMNGVPASLNAAASTSTVVDMKKDSLVQRIVFVDVHHATDGERRRSFAYAILSFLRLVLCG